LAGCRAENVGHHQDAFAMVDFLQQQARQRQDVERIVLSCHAKLCDQGRTLVEHVTNVLDQAFTKRAMRYQENTDHRVSTPYDRPSF
jgi:hypothetical protein